MRYEIGHVSINQTQKQLQKTFANEISPVVLYRVPDPEGGGSFLREGGPHVKQNPRKGVLNFLEESNSKVL